MTRIGKSKGDIGERAFLSWTEEMRLKGVNIRMEKRQVPMVQIFDRKNNRKIWIHAAKSGPDFFGEWCGRHVEVECKQTDGPTLNLRDAFSSRVRREGKKSYVSIPYRQLVELEQWYNRGCAAYVWWFIYAEGDGHARSYLIPAWDMMEAVKGGVKHITEDWAKARGVREIADCGLGIAD